MKSYSNDLVTSEQHKEVLGGQEEIKQLVNKVIILAITAIALTSITLIGVGVGLYKIFQ